MRHLKSILQTTIMLTAMVAFVMVESDVKGQCEGECGTGPFETYSHNDRGSDCDNLADGDCSFAVGVACTTDNAAPRSFVFGENITNSDRESFLVGWNGDKTFHIEDKKVSINTTTTHSEVDLFLDESGAGTTGNWGQNFGTAFPNFTGAGVKWAGSGESDPFIISPLTGMGLRYQWEEFATSYGLIERPSNSDIKDAVLVIDNENATSTSSTENILRIGYRWGDPAGTNGFDSLVHVYPRGNASNNIFEVYGAAGKPGGGSWSGLSDRRVKKNIQPYEDGLEQILKIEPVKYQYNEESGYKTDEQFVGVIAQDMEEIAPYMVIKEGKFLSYNSSALIYMLINAFQQEHEMFEEEKAKRERLEARIAELEEKFDAVFGSNETGNLPGTKDETSQEVTLSNAGIEEPLLYQNRPNPFKGSTEIGYYLPENTRDAIIIITEVETGKVIKRVALNETGSGTLRVNVENLSAGSYSYTLVIDGQQSLSRQMMLSR